MCSPWGPNRTSTSVGSGPGLPNQCGVRVSNSAAAGLTAGAAINFDLVLEETRKAAGAHRRQPQGAEPAPAR